MIDNNRILTKSDKEKCLLLWGCIPLDAEWVLEVDLFSQPIIQSIQEIDIDERNRRKNLKHFLSKIGVSYS